MRSDLLAENTNRAAALRTDCSRRNSVPDMPTITDSKESPGCTLGTPARTVRCGGCV